MSSFQVYRSSRFQRQYEELLEQAPRLVDNLFELEIRLEVDPFSQGMHYRDDPLLFVTFLRIGTLNWEAIVEYRITGEKVELVSIALRDGPLE